MKTFKDWILNKYDEDELEDIATHGCVSGCAFGLIYYAETTKAYDQHSEEIWEWLYYTAEDFGEGSIPALIASFNGAKNVMGEQQFKNLLVWAYVEHVALYAVENEEVSQ